MPWPTGAAPGREADWSVQFVHGTGQSTDAELCFVLDRGAGGGRLGFVGSCLGLGLPAYTGANGHRFVLPSCRALGFDSDGARAVADSLARSNLDRAYLTHYGALCSPEAIASAARQVNAGLSEFEQAATQAHCCEYTSTPPLLVMYTFRSLLDLPQSPVLCGL